MMDVKAAAEGRENIATPREMMTLLEDLYRGKVLNKQMTDDFLELLSIHKESYIPRELPEDLRIANKPGELEGTAVMQLFESQQPRTKCLTVSAELRNMAESFRPTTREIPEKTLIW